MNIAIMTQPLGPNYGGILQNYALKKVLEYRGARVTTINRISRPSLPKKLASKVKNHVFNRIKGINYYQPSTHELSYIYIENFYFIDKYINLSPQLMDSRQIKKYFNTEGFDVVIVGSDQTWRPKYSPCITNYFLDFLVDDEQIIKIAYACSFGTSHWEFSKRQHEKCQKLVSSFDAISVRESSGIPLCRKYLNTEAQLVLDPTMLLEKEDYIELIKNKFGAKPSEKQGVFNYILDDSEQKNQLVNDIADYFNVSHFRTQPNKKLPVTNQKDLLNYKYPSIEAWLSSFYTADYIVTDSFHGTVLSIIFEKPFITLVNKARGAARFESLLKLIGLENRMFYDISEVDKAVLDESIDYKAIKLKLEPLKKLSFDFLDSTLS